MSGPKIAVVLVATLAGVGGGGWLYVGKHKDKKPRFQTDKVHRQELVAQVTATGTVQPVTTSPVGAQVSGIVWKLHSDFNQQVKQGQILVELDPSLFKNAVDQAEANRITAEAQLAKAKAQLTDAERQKNRQGELAKEHFVAQADADTAQANYDAAVAQVRAAEAGVAQAKVLLSKARLDLEHSVIRSPVTGTVISRNVDVGQAVAASFTAPTLFTIAEDLSRMQVHASIDEADIGQVREGEVATFTVDAFRGERFQAKVVQVRNAATTVQNVVTYDVVMDVANEKLKLRPGMTASVKIVSAKKDGVLAVANAALRFKPPADLTDDKSDKGDDGKGGGGHGGGQGQGAPATGGGPAAGGGSGGSSGGSGAGGGHKRGKPEGPGVWVVDGEGVKRVPVEAGISDGSATEVVKGLDEGQEVIVDVLSDGKDVKDGKSGPGGMPRGFGRF